MSRHQAGDEEDEGGADAAALGSHREAKAREMKVNAVPEQRGAGNTEQQLCGIGGAVLQKGFERFFEEAGKRNQENKKRERKGKGAKCLLSETQEAGGNEQQEKGEGRPSEGIG